MQTPTGRVLGNQMLKSPGDITGYRVSDSTPNRCLNAERFATAVVTTAPGPAARSAPCTNVGVFRCCARRVRVGRSGPLVVIAGSAQVLIGTETVCQWRSRWSSGPFAKSWVHGLRRSGTNRRNARSGCFARAWWRSARRGRRGPARLLRGVENRKILSCRIRCWR